MKNIVTVAVFGIVCLVIGLAYRSAQSPDMEGLKALETRIDALVRVWISEGTPTADRRILLVLVDPYGTTDPLTRSEAPRRRGFFDRLLGGGPDFSVFAADTNTIVARIPTGSGAKTAAKRLSGILLRLTEAEANIRVLSPDGAAAVALDAAFKAGQARAAGSLPVLSRLVAPGVSVEAVERELTGLKTKNISVPAVGEAVFVWAVPDTSPRVIRYEVLRYGNTDTLTRTGPAKVPWRPLVESLLARGAAALPGIRTTPKLRPRRIPTSRAPSAGSRMTSPAPRRRPAIPSRRPDSAHSRTESMRARRRDAVPLNSPKCPREKMAFDDVCWDYYGERTGIGRSPGDGIFFFVAKGPKRWTEFSVTISVNRDISLRDMARFHCENNGLELITGEHHGVPIELCNEIEDPKKGKSQDIFIIRGPDYALHIEYNYPTGRRTEHLDRFLQIIEDVRPRRP